MTIMPIETKTLGGRPRGFDRDVALEMAMRLFWRHGYEGVSFQQLTAALGVAAPSLYAAFGNKAALYREALDRYAELRKASDLSFMDDCATLKDAARLLLEGTAQGLVDPEGEIGCMLNSGMIAAHPDHADLVKELATRRQDFQRLLTRSLERWVTAERSARLATYFATIMQGMAIQARDGASRETLLAIAQEACASLADSAS